MSQHDQNSSGRPRPGVGKKSKAGGLAVLVLVGAYSFAAPMLNDRFGWDLPAIKADAAGNVRMDESATKKESIAKKDSDKPTETASQRELSPAVAPESTSKPKSTGSGPLADRMRARDARPAAQDNRDANQNAKPPTAAAQDSDLLYGLLREVSRDRYISPAGLMYTPGSAEGHRLEHLRRHTVDDPGRAGSHGVFDGDMEGALAVIDRAYERAKKKQRTTVSQDDGRTTYTVDMGGRVGFIGGQTGKQKRNPMARRVRLVVEGNRVITAYPM